MTGMWFVERGLVPDPVLRWGIRRLLRERLRIEARRAAQPGAATAFMEELQQGPIAVHTQAANEQHYEVPSAFYQRVLGPRLKYSSGLWNDGTPNLAAAETAMLALTCERARLKDGHDVLELGCGWGSLSLYIAERYPRCRVTSVSNSRTQKAFIDDRARQRGLANVEVITADMNDFAIDRRFDRVISVEMFEHMRNHRDLLARVRGWLRDDGLLFVHIFCHDRFAYPFETDGKDDWMARYFFTGGIMPSFDLLPRFDRDLELAESWKVNGRHYARTLEAWLANMDRQRTALRPLFVETYGAPAQRRWWVYWRLFFLSCAELFAFNKGNEWYVGHYLFTPRAG